MQAGFESFLVFGFTYLSFCLTVLLVLILCRYSQRIPTISTIMAITLFIGACCFTIARISLFYQAHLVRKIQQLEASILQEEQQQELLVELRGLLKQLLNQYAQDGSKNEPVSRIERLAEAIAQSICARW